MSTRRDLLKTALGASASLLVAACTSSQPAAPTAAPAAAPKPTTAPAAAPAAQASPAAAPAATTAAQPAATGQAQAAPAALKGTKIAMLHWSSFVPEEDTWWKETLVNDWAKPAGVDLSVELVGQNDIQPKVVAAIQAGAGPDVVQLQYSWPWLYADKLTDVSDIADPAGPAGGGWYDSSQQTAQVQGKWRAVPYGMTGNAFAYRVSQLKAGTGSDQFPKTWEDLGKAGASVKQKTPFFLGQALGHSYGDPPSFVFPWLWSYGAAETDQTGKTVAINSDAAKQALTAFKSFWDEAVDPQCLSWDDSGNNKSYLAGQIWATINGSSIYLAALKQAKEIADDTLHANNPSGPKGQFSLGVTFAFGIPSYVKDPQPAKELLKYLIQPTTYGSFMKAGTGYTQAPYKKGETDLWPAGDAKLQPFKNFPATNRWYGYPGPPSAAATQSGSQYITVDLFARVAQGDSVDSSLQWAEGELKKVYNS